MNILFSPRSPRGLFFAWNVSRAKKEASHCAWLASHICPLARAAAWPTALAMPATVTTATTTSRWHEHPAA